MRCASSENLHLMTSVDNLYIGLQGHNSSLIWTSGKKATIRRVIMWSITPTSEIQRHKRYIKGKQSAQSIKEKKKFVIIVINHLPTHQERQVEEELSSKATISAFASPTANRLHTFRAQ